MPNKAQYMKGYRTEYLSSDPNTTALKYTTKTNENVYKKAGMVDLRSPELAMDLLGMEIKTNVILGLDIREYGKKVRITDVYPKIIVGEYTLGDKKMKTCFGVGDLVTSGLLTFVHGYPEVVK